MFIGTAGFVAWFEAIIYSIIYNKVRKACKNIFVKIFIHLLGLLSIFVGIYFLIATMPSGTSIAGMFLALIGLVIFLIPIGVD